MSLKSLKFDNRFMAELPADTVSSPVPRQVFKSCYSRVQTTSVKAPLMVSFASDVAQLIDLTDEDCNSDGFLNAFVGNDLLDGMQPYSMCYGGHQFGNWAGQLGDGRAINLGEVLNKQGQRWALQLKGAGRTPYSRTADGLAVLRSSVREYLCSEAMHHLGVPTTRALSLINTGEQVMRDMLYDGHPEYEPTSVVCRVAPSFIRFGSFQIFSSRGELDELRLLTDYTIRTYFPHLLEKYEASTKAIYLAWFQEVCDLTVTMVVHWMRVGFVHGVMNTDNMSIHGLTIDYGPYGWLDDFNPGWTPNTTDSQNRRYRYSQQPNVALWNCYQLANAVFPLVEDTGELESILESFQIGYQNQWREMMARKLGLLEYQDGDQVLFESLESLLAQVETDMTIFYRRLANETLDIQNFSDAYYQEKLPEEYQKAFQGWLGDYQKRLAIDGLPYPERQARMNAVNPKYVFRNYLAQNATDTAEAGDFSAINELLDVFRQPYSEQAEYQKYATKRPDWARTKVGCSMLSCSS